MDYEAETSGILVTVTPHYLAGQSSHSEQRYVWAYHVVISNRSSVTVQLLSRYWHITDGSGRVQEVNGAGVVGEQPVLAPGESFSYTSGCPLSTPSGFMSGHYVMVSSEGETMRVTIPTFSLDMPEEQRTLN